MMRYRVADDEEESQEPGDHRPQHNGTITLILMVFLSISKLLVPSKERLFFVAE